MHCYRLTGSLRIHDDSALTLRRLDEQMKSARSVLNGLDNTKSAPRQMRNNSKFGLYGTCRTRHRFVDSCEECASPGANPVDVIKPMRNEIATQYLGNAVGISNNISKMIRAKHGSRRSQGEALNRRCIPAFHHGVGVPVVTYPESGITLALRSTYSPSLHTLSIGPPENHIERIHNMHRRHSTLTTRSPEEHEWSKRM